LEPSELRRVGAVGPAFAEIAGPRFSTRVSTPWAGDPSDEEGHALPALRVDVKAHRGEALDAGIRRDVGLAAIATVLAARRVTRVERLNHLENSHLLVAMASGPVFFGWSIARQAITCSMWFWITSRIAPRSSYRRPRPLEHRQGTVATIS
jgi:hypothetical protein